MSKYELSQLPSIANDIRRNIVKMVHSAGSGHPGGALGITDILVYLYFIHMNVDPAQPEKDDRDRFVLSPAHQVPGLYAVLAERGFFAKSELMQLREFGSKLQGHAYRNTKIGVETTGGSLGQGLSIAAGFALESRFRSSSIGSNNNQPFNTYCIVSDGELNEGQTWEAIMFAAREKLSNLIMIVDKNGIQLSNKTENLMPLEPIADKLREFNWMVQEVDGHDYTQLAFALRKSEQIINQPVAIVAKTIPGKGVSYMEHKWQWHGKAPDDEQLEQALKDLESE